jgi:hypothetical protein
VIPPGAGTRGGRLRDPREAITQLRQQLALHWPGRVYQGDSRGLSVLSISPELTVWCNGRDFIWYEHGRPVAHPAADPVTAALRLINRLQQLTGDDGGDDAGGGDNKDAGGAQGPEPPTPPKPPESPGPHQDEQ